MMPADLMVQFQALSENTKTLLVDNGFDIQRFVELVTRATTGQSQVRLEGSIEPPQAGDVEELPELGSAAWEELKTTGERELREGKCALLVMAGGMATRMGGTVKALVDAVPGHSFLDLRLAEQKKMEQRYGRRPPLWLMTSQATDEKIKESLAERSDTRGTATFRQHLSLRITPGGDIFLDDNGSPSLHATGHGDTIDALKSSGLLAEFLAAGGRTVLVTNVDNLGASLDPAVLGWHLRHGAPSTSEVVDKVGTDRGGIPARVQGALRAVEEFRLPSGFDASSVRVFNINSFWFDATRLSDLDMNWSYFPVEKKVDGHPVLQFERILNEVTTALPTRFLRVPRAGAESRFLPVKDMAELEARQAEIRDALRFRGLLEGPI